jgi:hypothetical protein
MNRTLRRPMFRMGGNAEGITSGLDTPKLNASRENFQNGNTDMESRYNRAMDFIKSKQAPRRSDFNDFLINFGLDLVSRPRSGNIFSQVATSAREPFAQFQASKAATRRDQDKLSQALIGDIMEQMSEEEVARIKSKGGQDDFMFERQQQEYTKLIQQQRQLEKELEKTGKFVGPAEKGAPQIAPDQAKIKNIEQQLEDNAKLQALYTGAEEDPTRKALLQAIGAGQYTFEDLIIYDDEKARTGKGRLPVEEDLAKGGRVGLQMGGQPMPAAMPTDQGPVQASPVQDLTFEELRARLPQIITDDIVTLIASSEQALTDFANIQTQQDVNSFNQKYEVNLQLPAEA